MNKLSLRVLNDPAWDGPTNMARDEALLRRVGRGESPATLRMYQWDPPTISLGYFQRYSDYAALPAPAGGLPVVRRLTGGGAILHDLELTYSLTLPIAHPLLEAGPNRLYELMHDVVIAALSIRGVHGRRCGVSDDSGAARGPFFCFARRHCYDVLVGEDKLAGSAQRRTRSAVLQHGSIVLANRFAQQPTAEVLGRTLSGRSSSDAGGEPAPTARTDERGDAVYEREAAQLRGRLVEGFVRVTGAAGTDGAWTEDEEQEARDLVPKYAGDSWTRRI